MFGTRWRVLRLRGIPVYVDVSWLFILALLTLTFAQAFPSLLREYFPEIEHLSPWTFWGMGLITALAFFLCILLHEMGHALVGRAEGTPVRGITLFMFGGVSELGEEPTSAANEFLMAAAGPIVSLVLALLLGALAAVGHAAGWPAPVVLVLGYLAFVNGMVLLFNLVPAFPLDGGRILRSFLWGVSGEVRSATYWSSLIGRLFAGVLIAIGVVEFFYGYWWNGIWLGLIGLFLHNAATSGYQQMLVRQALVGAPVRSFMNVHPVVVSPSLDLRHLVEDFIYRHHHKAFPVVSGEHLEGLVDTQSLMQVPRGEWDQHTVGEVMRHDLDRLTISPDADAYQALNQLRETEAPRLLVTESDHLVGIVGLKDLMNFLDMRLELEGGNNAAARRRQRERAEVGSASEPG